MYNNRRIQMSGAVSEQCPIAAIATIGTTVADDTFNDTHRAKYYGCVAVRFSKSSAPVAIRFSIVTKPQATARTPSSNSSTQALLPVLIFLGVNRVAGLRWAVVVATAWSVKVIVDRRRAGVPLGRFMPIITAAVIVRGAIGAITGSEAVYFGLGIATKYAVSAALATSLVLRRPLARVAAPYVLSLSPAIIKHQSFHTAMVLTTAIGALYYCVSATFDIWLFQRSSIEGFVVLRFLVNWPLGALCLLAILAVARHHLTKIPSVESLTELSQGPMAHYWAPDEK